jgi:hypothetical protein
MDSPKNQQQLWEHSQSGDVAERVVLVGAVALDGRVEGRVVVELRVVRRRAAAGVPADVPRRRRAQPQLAQDRVHRRRWTHARTAIKIKASHRP